MSSRMAMTTLVARNSVIACWLPWFSILRQQSRPFFIRLIGIKAHCPTGTIKTLVSWRVPVTILIVFNLGIELPLLGVWTFILGRWPFYVPLERIKTHEAPGTIRAVTTMTVSIVMLEIHIRTVSSPVSLRIHVSELSFWYGYCLVVLGDVHRHFRCHDWRHRTVLVPVLGLGLRALGLDFLVLGLVSLALFAALLAAVLEAVRVAVHVAVLAVVLADAHRFDLCHHPINPRSDASPKCVRKYSSYLVTLPLDTHSETLFSYKMLFRSRRLSPFANMKTVRKPS